MKQLQRLTATLVLALALLCPVALTTGCANPERTAYQTTGVVVLSVDAAMNGWGDYVRAGRASVEDETKVRSAYQKYQAIVRTQRVAVMSAVNSPEGESAFNMALNAIDAARIELVNLIQSLKKG